MNIVRTLSPYFRAVSDQEIPEPLAKIIFPLMKCWIILKIKVEISGEKRAAPEGPWVLGGGSEMPPPFYAYAGRIHKLHVRKVIKNTDAEQV